jgi:hypothetical protein
MSEKNISISTVGMFVVSVLLVGSAALSGSVGAQSQGQLSFNTTDITIAQGESETVAITYDSPDDVNPAGIEYKIQYNPEVITVINQNQGDYLGGSAVAEDPINTATGTVEYAEVRFAESGTSTDSGTVATITMEPAVAVDEGETATLTFSDVEVSDPEGSAISTTTDSATVQIDAGTSLEDDIANLTAPTDTLDFDDLQQAIQAYQNDEKIQGQELTFDALVSLIESYHDG